MRMSKPTSLIVEHIKIQFVKNEKSTNERKNEKQRKYYPNPTVTHQESNKKDDLFIHAGRMSASVEPAV